MREIKFRGFELDLKQWVYGGYHKHIKRQICPIGDSLKEEDIQHLIIVDGFADWNMPRGIQVVTNVDKNSIGQFTGLKDKNGREVYDGDVVRGFDRPAVIKIGHVHNEKNSIYGVFAEWVKYGLVEAQYIDRIYKTDYIEVIGNIYENPELLEVEQ